jgi:NADPH:quinone reductase-like Zn-dependent oxidoreductase
MLFDYARAQSGQTVLVHGGAGNVGAYAVQLARHAGLRLFASAASDDLNYVGNRGAGHVVNYKTTKFEDAVSPVDVVIDTVGGDTPERSFTVSEARRYSRVGRVAVSRNFATTSPRPFRVLHRGSDIARLFESGEYCLLRWAPCYRWKRLERHTRCSRARHTNEARSC